jgi:hypothetical protein
MATPATPHHDCSCDCRFGKAMTTKKVFMLFLLLFSKSAIFMTKISLYIHIYGTRKEKKTSIASTLTLRYPEVGLVLVLVVVFRMIQERVSSGPSGRQPWSQIYQAVSAGTSKRNYSLGTSKIVARPLQRRYSSVTGV